MENQAISLTELMRKLNDDVTFRPDDGAFRSRLTEIVTSDADAGFAELFSKLSGELLVCISGRTADEGIIRFLACCDQGENSLKCPLALLGKEEIVDLEKQLSRIIAEQLPPVVLPSKKAVVRNKLVTGMLDLTLASQAVGCSEDFLKSKIPCSDYSYEEIDGKTEIKGYYWSQQLIDRLCLIKANGVKPEDVSYVAAECCYDDSKWAEEILASLVPQKSKVRVEGTLSDSGGAAPDKGGARLHRHNRRRPQKKKT
jgi:hypothetical protein